MISHFLNLEWKQYFRSSYWQKGIGIKILLSFFALYFIVVFLFAGIALFPMLKKTYPEKDPFVLVNGALFLWILCDLMARFFLQKLPVMTIKPLLALPVKRGKIINYVLGKSMTSFFNFLPLFAFIPFSVVLISKGYASAEVLSWLIALVLIVLCLNFLNFVVENLTAKSDFSFLPLMIVVSGVFALDYFGIISFSELFAAALIAISKTPVLLLIPVVILIGLYYANFKILEGDLFLDAQVKDKEEVASTTEYKWTNMFGEVAPFMQLDLKLITRNKRTKSTLWLLLIGVLYGLIFYPNPQYADKEYMFAFVGIFSTGLFLINFGQFIPAWDSGYYKMLMSQNFKYERYLKSKFVLMSISVVLLFLLEIPYVYFGWKILMAHFAAAIYNIGVNSHIIMYGGTFNRKKINLDQKAAFNYQGTGAVQWLLGIPLMLIPMALFGVVNWLAGFEVAIATMILLGVAGIVFHQKLMKAITQKYITNKYAMIHGFNQEN